MKKWKHKYRPCVTAGSRISRNLKNEIQNVSCRFAWWAHWRDWCPSLASRYIPACRLPRSRQNADTHCYFSHQLTHCFFRNSKTPQGRGVDAVAVAPDDVQNQRFTRVNNVATLIHRKNVDVLWLHEVPHYVWEVLSHELRIHKYEKNR